MKRNPSGWVTSHQRYDVTLALRNLGWLGLDWLFMVGTAMTVLEQCHTPPVGPHPFPRCRFTASTCTPCWGDHS